MIDFIQVDDDGKILMEGLCGDKELDLQKVEGCTAIKAKGSRIDDYYDWKNKKVKKKPPCPGQSYEFCYKKHEWVFDETEAWTLLRQERDRRLKESDWVLLEDVPMSAAKKEAWMAYRKALRDLPDQVKLSGFNSFEWPEVP